VYKCNRNYLTDFSVGMDHTPGNWVNLINNLGVSAKYWGCKHIDKRD
jgi:hypothetical protein